LSNIEFLSLWVDKQKGFLYPKFKMLKNIPILPSFSMIKKGKLILILKEEYKDFLLQQGIEDLKTFLRRSSQTIRYLKGRTPHPSIPLEGGKRMVLRQYSHGGLFRAITGNLYLFGSRAFRELALTEEIRSCGIPTIQPIGAIHQFNFSPFYKAYFLSLEIPHVKDLIQYLREVGTHPSHENLSLKRKMIRSAGHLLRKFHQSGFFHRDLQLKNILVAGEQLLLIDFDRSYRKQILSTQERMKNLLRLNRSLEKWRRLGLPITRTDQWRFFSVYAEGDMKIREAMQKALQTYSFRSLFYRCGWALEKKFGVKSS
jgi:tRNA A-37 threonylcarbamoyl transferase component Bud32